MEDNSASTCFAKDIIAIVVDKITNNKIEMCYGQKFSLNVTDTDVLFLVEIVKKCDKNIDANVCVASRPIPISEASRFMTYLAFGTSDVGQIHVDSENVQETVDVHDCDSVDDSYKTLPSESTYTDVMDFTQSSEDEDIMDNVNSEATHSCSDLDRPVDDNEAVKRSVRNVRPKEIDKNNAHILNQSPLSCTKCQYTTTVPKNMISHIEINHEIKCPLCDFYTTRLDLSNAHMLKYHPFKCTMCKYITSSSKKLKRHIKVCHDEKRALLRCSICDFSCVFSGNLKRHMMKKHTDERPFKCDVCSYACVRSDVMKNHKLFNHSNEFPYLCVQCGYKCKLKRYLKVHIVNKHNGEGGEELGLTAEATAKIILRSKRISASSASCLCSECGHQSTTISNHAIHMITHTGEKPHKCTQCDYRAAFRISLKRHIMSKHTEEKRYKCSQCDYKTTVHNSLKQHFMSKHTGEKPYLCVDCDYRTASPANIKRHHIAKHTNVRPWKCSHCDYASVASDQLKQHVMSKHTGERPHKCHLCNCAYTLAQSLKKHLTDKHPGSDLLCPTNAS